VIRPLEFGRWEGQKCFFSDQCLEGHYGNGGLTSDLSRVFHDFWYRALYEGCVQKSGDIRGTCTYNLASGPYEKPGKPCKP
jgi:hypothetical protein